MIKKLFFSILVISSLNVQSQKDAVTVKGTVLDFVSQQPIPYASVVIRDKSTQELIDGVSTDENGFFKMAVLTEKFIIEIRFIGFEDYVKDDYKIVNNTVDLGKIELNEQSDQLEEVEVTAEKSTTEFRLDKRVFNVGKDLSSTGASALEVLDNVPSVTVSIEGQVSLRGNSGVQILINGKPSVLASESGNGLGTITADMIDKVEVITNPSAKYEAEGTAGIINIVIKKEERSGLNGSLTLNFGSPQNNNVGLSMNRRTEKFNLFTQLGYGFRKYPRRGKNENLNLITNDAVHTEGIQYRNEEFYNIILGTDYYINPQNVVTLSGFYAYEIEDQPSKTNVKIFENLTDLIAEWNREEVTEAGNPKYQYEFIYKKDFLDDEDHTFIFSATGNLFSKEQSSEFFNRTVSGNATFEDQQTSTDFREAVHTFKLDYTHPFSDGWAIEAGSQFSHNDVSNDYEVKDDVDGTWVINDGFTNTFDFQQSVLGIYGTTSYESDIWGVKLGLRRESTVIKTNLVNSNQKNEQNFTDLFPTFHTSYKLLNSLSLQAGYSRRIYRPRLWELNPFFNIRNSFNFRKGNPNLSSEYSDSYEISAIYTTSGVSMNFSLYQLNTTNVIEFVSTFEDNITIRSPQNLGTKTVNGIEVNGKFDLSKSVVINGDFNFNAFSRQATWLNQSFDFEGNQWSSEITSKLKMPKDFDVELTFNYQSGFKTIDGESFPNRFINFGVRKKLFKGKGVISLILKDVFASRVDESRAVRNHFITKSRTSYGTFFVAGLSYGFGKGEAMEFRSRRR